MSDDELIERMAKVMALQPWGELHPGSKARLLSDARAALAVAEPVIRERCAAVADAHLQRIPDHNPDVQRDDLVAQGYGNAALNIADAIRTGGTTT